MTKVSISIVLHNTEKNELNDAIESCLNTSTSVNIFLIDNSSNNKLSYLREDKRVKYLKSSNNGFSAGHNLAISEFNLLENYDYHIVMNPDIKFDSEVITNIINYMDSNIDVGVLMPRIINSDGSLQFARKLLPSPLDIVIKRFFPKLLRTNIYEMRDLEPNHPVEIIALCGCFLFFRTDSLKSVGLFDTRYFMYFEDFDICRRIASEYKAIYYPNSKVFHRANSEHRRNNKLFFYSIQSTLKYFNKWGYFDKSRNALNIKTIQQVKKASKGI
jgi:hypothetical protein